MNPDAVLSCVCPDGGSGVAECGADGVYGTCECEVSASTGTVESTGVAETTSGWSDGSSSTSGGSGPCLPLDDPCPGTIAVHTDVDVVAIASCSRIEGSLQVRSGVTDLSPLVCLRELGEQLLVDSLTLESLDGLSNLQRIDSELEVVHSGLSSLQLDSLEYVRYFSIYENQQLETLGVPNLETIEVALDVAENPQLSTCEIAELVASALSPMGAAYYQDNLDDCPSFP